MWHCARSLWDHLCGFEGPRHSAWSWTAEGIEPFAVFIICIFSLFLGLLFPGAHFPGLPLRAAIVRCLLLFGSTASLVVCSLVLVECGRGNSSALQRKVPWRGSASITHDFMRDCRALYSSFPHSFPPGYLDTYLEHSIV